MNIATVPPHNVLHFAVFREVEYCATRVTDPRAADPRIVAAAGTGLLLPTGGDGLPPQGGQQGALRHTDKISSHLKASM